MSKDYVYRTYSKTHSNRKPFSLVLALFVLGLIALFIVGLVHLKRRHQADRLIQHVAVSSIPKMMSASVNQQSDSQKSHTESTGEEQFQFYNMLPRLKVDVSDVQPDISTSEDPKMTKRYVLQIASFTHLAEAERLKGQLKQLGIEAYFSTISRGDNTYYRVQAGPFEDENSAVSTCDRLRINNLDCFILTLKEING